MQRIIIGSDHGGFELKQALTEAMASMDIVITDMGVHTVESVDYPDIAQRVCDQVLHTEGSLGVLICGTGIGISIAANKVRGIRAALCSEEYSAQMARQHNNANVLCLGGRVTGSELAKSILTRFMATPFEGGRHQRRVDKLE